MGESVVPCPCENGTIVKATYMDDWNRVKFETRITCPACLREYELRTAALNARKQEAEVCFQKAQILANQRYLSPWLDSFKGCTVKAAWLRYTTGSGYPSLGTFYKHVRDHGGLLNYLEWCFSKNIRYEWKRFGIKDEEIETLLEHAQYLTAETC